MAKRKQPESLWHLITSVDDWKTALAVTGFASAAIVLTAFVYRMIDDLIV